MTLKGKLLDWLLQVLIAKSNRYNDRFFPDWEKHYKPRLYAFENLHKGESCFIIGNGPSLNQMDLSPLQDCLCFGLNKIHLHPDVHEFGVDFHVAINPLVIQQSFGDFKSLNCPSFLSYRASAEQDRENSDYNYVLTEGTHSFSTDPKFPMGEGCTVTYVAMQLAYFMGFKHVFLIGVDHSFEYEGLPNQKQTLGGPDRNHFHPDYFAGKEWHLPDLKGSELAYQLAQYYYRKDGREILDATLGGKLQVFPKITFEEALERCKSR